MTTKIEPINQSKAEELTAWAISLQIVDPETRYHAGQLALELRDGVKTIKNFYKDKKRNAKNAYDALVKEEKDFIEPYLEAQKIIDKKISDDYLERQKQTAEQQEALRKLNTSGEEWSPEQSIVLPEAQRSLETDGGSLNVRPDIEVEVEDRMALIRAVSACKYPIDYLIVNLPFIKKDCKQNGWTEIDGLKITKSTVVTGRVK